MGALGVQFFELLDCVYAFRADTITETLSQRSSIRKNMRVISNRMLFDSSGVSYGFSHPVIHSYNKGHSAEQFSTVFDEVKVRTYI